MTKYLAVVVIVGVFCFSLSAEESYPPPTVAYLAPTTDTVRIAEQNGRGPEARLENITLFYKQDQLVEHPYFHFPGSDAAIVIDDAPVLNPMEQLTLAVWFKPDVFNSFAPQKPLILKSCPTHTAPFYQYGLIIYDDFERGRIATLVLSLGGKLFAFETPGGNIGGNDSSRPFQMFNGWNHLAGTFDGQTAVIYLNGVAYEAKAKEAITTPITIDRYPTPLVVGTYGTLPRNEDNSFTGQIGEFALWDKALTAKEVAALAAAKRNSYPPNAETNVEDSDYSRAINAALAAPEDVWTKEVLATGDPSFDKVKDYLRPLFYSTGKTYREYAPHNVVLGLEDGVRPLIAAAADGGGVYNNKYYSEDGINFYVGVKGEERFGASLDRLGETYWEEGWLPVLHTSYTTADGAKWRQELIALMPTKPDDKLVAMGRLELVEGTSTLRITLPSNVGTRFRASAGKREENVWVWTPSDSKVLFYAFALGNALPSDLNVDADSYQKIKDEWVGYWRKRIENDGILFSVPEKLVMDCQRNKLYQNLVLRWRYSVGNAVYDNLYFPWECQDTLVMLAVYGHQTEARKGLVEHPAFSKAPAFVIYDMSANLIYPVEYWHYTHDDTIIRERVDIYRGIMRDFQQQMANDPRGLLKPYNVAGDLPDVGYGVPQLTFAWRGMRDMSWLLERLGYEQDAAEFGASAEKFRTNLGKAIAESQRRLPDGTLFVPMELNSSKTTIFDPICETRQGSYWNLVIHYAFCSGFWSMEGEDMNAIIGFLRKHGSFLLGLVRFNYYPTDIGAYRPHGLAGYYTYGMDNVYLPSILRILVARDETEPLLLTFYSYLAHGMTRGTFMAGEGDSIGVYPGHFYRSMYGSFTNTQNTAFLQALRALLIQETYDADGAPSALRLTPATPKVWLEEGKTISFQDAPTIFGPLSGKIVSHVNDNRVTAEWILPSRNAPSTIHWRVRLPGEKKIASVKVDGKAYEHFDSTTGVIDLTGLKGAVSVEVTCR